MRKISFWVSLLLMIATFAIVKTMHIGTDVVVWKKNINKIPYTIGGIQGVDIPLEGAVIKELDTDAFIFRNYISREGSVINLYVGYYGTRKGGRSAHNPEGCYPGAGWAIINESNVTLTIEHGGKENIPLNTLLVNKGNVKEIVYHWYQTEGGIVTVNGIQQNLNRFKSRLMHNRDDGAFIRVSKDLNNNYLETKEDIENFIRQLFPLLIKYWPEEKELKDN
jgi:EpsI family protein